MHSAHLQLQLLRRHRLLIHLQPPRPPHPSLMLPSSSSSSSKPPLSIHSEGALRQPPLLAMPSETLVAVELPRQPANKGQWVAWVAHKYKGTVDSANPGARHLSSLSRLCLSFKHAPLSLTRQEWLLRQRSLMFPASLLSTVSK